MVEKIKKFLKREVLYYLITLVILAFIMHFDLLTDPLPRLELMQDKENYSHPFVYAFVVYVVILVIRKIIDFFSGLFKKKSN